MISVNGGTGGNGGDRDFLGSRCGRFRVARVVCRTAVRWCRWSRVVMPTPDALELSIEWEAQGGTGGQGGSGGVTGGAGGAGGNATASYSGDSNADALGGAGGDGGTGGSGNGGSGAVRAASRRVEFRFGQLGSVQPRRCRWQGGESTNATGGDGGGGAASGAATNAAR